MTTYPKIKTNLQTQSESAEGVLYYIIKEPTSGKFIRLREPEHFLLTSLDGTRAPADAAGLFVKTFNKTISPEAVAQFAAKMADLGFLEGTQAKREKHRSVLFIPLKAFDPKRSLDWLYPKTRWLFSTPMIWIQTIAVLLGGVIFIANIEQFPFKLASIFHAADILTIIVCIFLITIVHEYAHALTCRHFGGNVREMGFLLLYFQPCFYCNVSDAYLFPNRRERLLVTLAGIGAQLVLWGGFAILWRITIEGYFLNRVFYLVAAICFATTVFNLNPAIKLDGYYLLADYLRIPNLRQKAFDHIWTRIRVRLFGCTPTGIVPSAREAKIYWRYGLLAIAYSALLIFFILYRGGQFLIEKWEGAGFVLFLVLSLTIFQRLLVKWWQAFASIWRERNKVWMKPKRIVIYIVLIVLVVTASILIHVGQTTGGAARLFAAESYVVKRVGPSLLEGRYFRGGIEDLETSQIFQLSTSDYAITQIQPRFSIGDTVHAGDTLLTINSATTAGLLAEAESELKRAEADRRLLLSDPKAEEIATKRADIKQAEAVYEAARKENNRVKELHSKQLISDDNYERSVSQFKIASSSWDSKKSELKLLRSAPKAAAVERMDAEIEKLQARTGYLQSQLSASTVVSPFAGVMIGTADAKDLLQLARTESLMVEIDLRESNLDLLNPGASMELRVSAFPGTRHFGKVLKFKLSPQLRAIATVANLNHNLLPEMTGYAKVDCGRISVAGLLGRKISRFFRLELWSWF
jgi:putative peptide zinc metalloprotease protein